MLSVRGIQVGEGGNVGHVCNEGVNSEKLAERELTGKVCEGLAKIFVANYRKRA